VHHGEKGEGEEGKVNRRQDLPSNEKGLCQIRCRALLISLSSYPVEQNVHMKKNRPNRQKPYIRKSASNSLRQA
jgi:hypothetical protein